MGDVGQFLSAVFSTAVELVGIVLTLLTFIENIPSIKKWLKEKSFLAFFPRLLRVIGIFCMVAGFYVAWHKEHSKVVALMSEPKVRIEFQNTDEYVVPPRLRPDNEPWWFIRVKLVVSDGTLVGARAFFTNISKVTGPPMLPGGRVQIGAYRSQPHSFEPQTCKGEECYFGLFFTDEEGRILKLFIPGEGGADWFREPVPSEFQSRQPLPAGIWNVTVSIKAENVHYADIVRTFSVKWSGDMGGFHME